MGEARTEPDETVRVSRAGAVVTMTFVCRDEYAAIELYDSMLEECRETGRMTIKVSPE